MTQMYFTAEDAAMELQKRQSDQDLVAHIEEWRNAQGIALPTLPTDKPAAYFARQIATCRYEDIVFQNIARSAGLTPVWIEFVEDKFVTHSPYKRSLVHRYYCAGRGRKGGWKISKRNGIKIDQYDGKPMSMIRLSDGQSLVEYHHALQDMFLDGPIRQDLSKHLQSYGTSHEFYYPFLSMFLLHGVLVEDYHECSDNKSRDMEIDFAKKVFEPTWQRIVDEVGLQPIIIHLPWVDGMQYFPSEGYREHCVIDCDVIFRHII